MADQASQIAFAHTTQFDSAPAEKLAERLLTLAPPNFRDGGRVYFTSGGSEATETAIKLARQYWLECGDSNRFRIVSRRQSYHGSTLGAMSVSGNVGRRAPYQPLLAEWGHIAPCFCYHCPFDLKFPSCDLACANDLDGLGLWPQPRHVDMRIADQANRELLQPRFQQFQFCVSRSERCIKAGLVALFKRREVDCFDGRV